MPLGDLGYRAWNGRTAARGTAWVVIAWTGIVLAWQSMWLRRLLFLAWGPTVVAGTCFFGFERLVEDGKLTPQVVSSTLVRRLPKAEALLEAMKPDPSQKEVGIAKSRRTVWAWILMMFMRSPQAILLVVLVGVVAPPLVSRDLGARAHLVYFTRPISRWEYILGKSMVVSAYVSGITLVPALVLWVLGVLLSPSIAVIWTTWDMPLRIIAASMVLLVPTTLLSLALSSLSHQPRWATFAWFSVWSLGWIAHGAFIQAAATSSFNQPIASEQVADMLAPLDSFLDSQQFDHPDMLGPGGLGGGLNQRTNQRLLDAMLSDRFAPVSMFHTLGVVQAWVFGLEDDLSRVWPSMVMLSLVSIVSACVLLNRVTAPLRA